MMHESLEKKKGLFIVTTASLVFMMIYILSIVHTKSVGDSRFMYRAWGWTEYFIGICAILVMIKKYRDLKIRYITIGILWMLISSISYYYRTNFVTIVPQIFIITVTFIAGCLMSDGPINSAIVNGNFKKARRSLIIGIGVSIPLAVINLMYFKNTYGIRGFEPILKSAFLALQPGIAEEIIFRFFIINILMVVLSKHFTKKTSIILSFTFGIVPHSLVHFSELWMINPIGAISMLILTCSLFGLPMAYLQYKRDLETAMAFHWFIDFVRFWGGY